MPGAELKFLLSALQRRDMLPADEIDLLKSLPTRVRSFKANHELVSQGSRPTESCLLLRGFAGRAKIVLDGKRQLAAIHVPGDFVDLHALLLKKIDHSVVALGPCEAAYIPHRSLHELITASPHLGRLLWLATVIDSATEREWITCLGRRSAAMHLAHILCELFARLEVVGLVKDRSFDLPLTQTDLADALGLSVVHVNRTLQELRGEKLVSWERRTVTILDHERLRAFADFDPSYLDLVVEPR
jgi:CRP-like cAMP-binding protein